MNIISYEEFIVLAALNTWVDEGLPDDYVARFAASSSEGDPRGSVSHKVAKEVFRELLDKGWARLGKASDQTSRTFAYSSAEGTAVFSACKDYWMKRARRS